jgi:hypothetical protein
MAKKIRGIEGMSADQLNFELQHGARFVVFNYCVSVLVMTFRRASDIYLLKPDESAVGKGLPFTLISLLLGWWGIPWDPFGRSPPSSRISKEARTSPPRW